MYEIEKVEFNKWVKTLNDAQLSKYDVSLINLIIENFDEIAQIGTTGGKRGKYLVSKIKDLTVNDVVKLKDFPEALDNSISTIKELNELKVESFRGFKEKQTFNLNKKYVLFYGPNGSGKSSLCQALEYSLLGYIQEANTRKIKLNEYIKNSLTNNAIMPELTCLYPDSNKPKAVISNYEAYRFSFIEKNRIDAFSHINATTPSEKSERLSALFGLTDFTNFVSEFTDNIERYFDLTTPKKDDFERKSHFLSQKKAEIEKRKNDLQTLNSEITSEIKKLKKTNIQTLEKALVYLNGENNNGEIYTIQNKISNLKNQIITLNLSNLSELQKTIDSKISEYKRLQNELTAMAVNSNFYDLYNALAKLADEKLDYCPACKTPIEKTFVNPFTNAKLEIENFRKFEETKKSINSVLTELRNNILSFNNEIKNNYEKIQIVYQQIDELYYPNAIGITNEQIINLIAEIECKARRIKEFLSNSEKINNRVLEINTETNGKIQELDNQAKELNSIYKTLLENKGTKQTYIQQILDFEKEEKEFHDKSVEIQKEIAIEAANVKKYEEFIKSYSRFKAELEAYIQQLPIDLAKNLSDKITEYYNILNINDAEFDKIKKFTLPITVDDDFTLTLADDITGNALQFLSEGHVKLLGLSILLAKATEHHQNFIIFDDVVNAIDDEHRLGVIQLLTHHPDFDNTQLILTCHGDNFIAQFENEVSSTKNKSSIASYVFLFTTNIDERGICVEISDPMNALTLARDNINKGRIKDAAQKARQAMECLSFKLWSKISKLKYDSQINVSMRGPKSIPDLKSIVQGLSKKLDDFAFSEEENLKYLFTEILKDNNWKILNKGTHYEEDQREFSRQEVLQVIEILEKMDEKITSFKIKVNVNPSVTTVHSEVIEK